MVGPRYAIFERATRDLHQSTTLPQAVDALRPGSAALVTIDLGPSTKPDMATLWQGMVARYTSGQISLTMSGPSDAPSEKASPLPLPSGSPSPTTANPSIYFGDEVAAELARAQGKLVLASNCMPMRVFTQPAIAAGDVAGEAWGVAAVGAIDAEIRKFTGAGVTIAILDTGIDHHHPAFKDLFTKPTADAPENYKDFTGTDLIDRVGHGTHCAGIAFGRDVGVTRIGVARGVTRVLIAKVADGDGLTSTETLIRAMHWAVDQGADIISISVGLDFLGHADQLEAEGRSRAEAIATALTDYRDYALLFDTVMSELSSQASVSRSALIIAASGNESHADADPAYRIVATLPAIAQNVVSVGAVTRDGAVLRVAPFSNARPKLCAPGTNILSAVPGGGLGTKTGTSQAAPHVAGVAALWWQKMRDEIGNRPTPGMVQDRLLGHADYGAIAQPRTSNDIGLGMVVAP